jgi:hypothetical protein
MKRAWPWPVPRCVEGHDEGETPAVRDPERIDFVAIVQKPASFVEVRIRPLELFEEKIGPCHASR